jgi:hypothetical protein
VIFKNGVFGSADYWGEIHPLISHVDHWTIKKYEVVGNIHEY